MKRCKVVYTNGNVKEHDHYDRTAIADGVFSIMWDNRVNKVKKYIAYPLVNIRSIHESFEE